MHRSIAGSRCFRASIYLDGYGSDWFSCEGLCRTRNQLTSFTCQVWSRRSRSRRLGGTMKKFAIIAAAMLFQLHTAVFGADGSINDQNKLTKNVDAYAPR